MTKRHRQPMQTLSAIWRDSGTHRISMLNSGRRTLRKETR
jgi:hypothetical protein